jgi:hypothetical protein
MPNDIYRRIKHRSMAAVSNIDFTTNDTNDIVLKVNDWIRSRYYRISRAFSWPELMRNYSLTLTASTSDYALRRDVDDVLSVFDETNGREIKERSIQEHFRFRAPTFEVAGNVLTGQPEFYHHIGEKGVKSLLTQAETIRVVSTSASDASPVVLRIHGEVSGVEVGTTLTLNGTSNVDGTQTYDSGSELRVSAGTSDGTLQEIAGVVTVKGTTSGTVYAEIAPGERGFTYKWIKIHPQTASSGTQPTLKIFYKKRLRPLVHDADMPEIDCADEIVEGVIADALWEDGQENSAQVQEAKFSQLVNELWIAKGRRNRNLQFAPENDDTENLANRIFLT